MVHCKLVPLKNPIIPMNLVPLNNIKSKKVYSDVPLEESEDKATPSCIPVSGPGLSKIIMRAGGFTHYVIIGQ